MSKPPIKAMEAVKRYCEKKKTCDGCPLHTLNDYGYCFCHYTPASWEIKKEGERSNGTLQLNDRS